MNGYQSAAYTQSFSELGIPLRLPRSGGWLLERQIPGTRLRDARCCYPVFACDDWERLPEDLANLPDNLVTITMVTDAFCPLTRHQLEGAFQRVSPLGQHHLIDLPGFSIDRLSQHHQRTLRRARQHPVDVDVESCPKRLLDDWMNLYSTLVRKHQISGLRLFSRQTMEQQLAVPGAVLLTARLAGTVIGAHWYYHSGEHVYGHLAAFSDAGYDADASYLLQSAAIEHFKPLASVIDYGGAPTISARPGGGLDDFKAGWGSRLAPVYLCGSVLRPEEYQLLAERPGTSPSDFFPAYRRDEVR